MALTRKTCRLGRDPATLPKLGHDPVYKNFKNLILHGLEDPIAPVLDARALASAFPQPAEILEVPGAGHSNVVGIGGDALMDRVGDFLDLAVPSGAISAE
jgi:pimeloyl-ACP methyl ester carboxylesterase